MCALNRKRIKNIVLNGKSTVMMTMITQIECQNNSTLHGPAFCVLFSLSPCNSFYLNCVRCDEDINTNIFSNKIAFINELHLFLFTLMRFAAIKHTTRLKPFSCSRAASRRCSNEHPRFDEFCFDRSGRE